MKWILRLSSFAFVGLGMYAAPGLQRYARVESYEIRPGILATPGYSSDGTLCEISVEKRHVQRDTVELGSTVPRKLALEMIDELAPPSERGKPTIKLANQEYIDEINGSTVITIATYENISVQIFRATSDPGDVAVILKWKNAKCPG